MPKLERILKLAHMTREHRAGTVSEMSHVCGVSQRTVYRYLNTLSDLRFQDNLQAAFAVDDKSADRLDRDDRCLICFALDNNPLAEHPFFRRKLARIRQVLLEGTDLRGQANGGRWIEVAAGRKRVRPERQNHLVKTFVEACLKGRAVSLRLRGRHGAGLVLQPRRIRLLGDKMQLLFLDPEVGGTRRFDLADVVSLRPRPVRAGAKSPVARGGHKKS